ncbi:hypothetical protein AWRI1499_4935 [Brettanomyces bruxellensis AWRI1499]|nr:hypothetical protein AWRI1499_4935 [Brettanomyces bruxellensis AWRI1499]
MESSVWHGKAPLTSSLHNWTRLMLFQPTGTSIYTEMSSSEIEHSPSKQLLESLPKLKDQFVVRFEKWEDGEVRRVVLETAKMLGADILGNFELEKEQVYRREV